MPMSPVVQKFVLHWGEMGTRWGINRTVAQIHALLYLSPEPLNAEEMAETLSVARSNVSNSLRELQGWGIVRVVHKMGDRRDHFESMQDVWEMFVRILDERKRREIDPTLAVLREAVADARPARAGSDAPKPRRGAERPPPAAGESAGRPRGGADAHVQARLAAMLDFFEQMNEMYGNMRGMPIEALMKMARLSDKLRKLLGAG
ncbi:MAG: hypothetical protein CHACPFDD_01752 [Phycisphaerae bacterium]|nr:hypothetical protein [Phycisphaerae bacterium]